MEQLTNTDAYTIRAIGEDDFSDVPIPDAPVQPANAPHTSTAKSVGSTR